MPTAATRMMRSDFDGHEERRSAAYVTILRRHPLLGVDHCILTRRRTTFLELVWLA